MSEIFNANSLSGRNNCKKLSEKYDRILNANVAFAVQLVDSNFQRNFSRIFEINDLFYAGVFSSLGGSRPAVSIV